MRHITLTFLLLVVATGHAAAAEPGQFKHPDYVGSHDCKQCHQAEFKQWRGSHHELAMQVANQNTVLGDFDDATFAYAGVTSRFFRTDQGYFVETDNADGELQVFPVEYVFGVYPLQQYLLALPGGRLNALSISWDSRPEQEGGQRWYHLYPDEEISAGDPLHWTGHYQNWNSRCAECHSTDLKKNYSVSRQEYATTWNELSVGCEACHGAGKNHIEQALKGEWTDRLKGLEVALADRKIWQFKKDESIAHTSSEFERAQQVETCGRCHARRGTIGDYQHNRDLLDTHRLSLLEPDLYHPDGQILDEVYVYGSFTQSKMYMAGVVCSDCHNPHSGQLYAEGNQVCASCHLPDTYDQPSHHHHTSQAGTLCANCHMPETTYMGVDPRRDHAMSIPRPDLSLVMGTPNACTACHSDKDASWALEATRSWGIDYANTSTHRGRIMQQAHRGDARAVPGLIAIAQSPNQAPIWRASAMDSLGQFATQETYQTALSLLQSTDPLMRMSAVRALEFLPPQQRFRVLNPRLRDPSRAVRMETARVLADIPAAQLDPTNQQLLEKLQAEYLEVLMQDGDMPGVQMQLGLYYTAQQRLAAAEIAYREALRINPQFVPVMLNLADLYRQQRRDDKARILLEDAIAIAPQEGAAYHAIGLLETRAGNQKKALVQLQKAAELEQAGSRHRYVYAIALHDNGDINGAINVLQKLNRKFPDSPDTLLALINYCMEAGRMEEAKRYAKQLKTLLPPGPQLQQLFQRLGV